MWRMSKVTMRPNSDRAAPHGTARRCAPSSTHAARDVICAAASCICMLMQIILTLSNQRQTVIARKRRSCWPTYIWQTAAKRERRKIWVHETIRKRDKLGEFCDRLVQKLRQTEQQSLSYFKMARRQLYLIVFSMKLVNNSKTEKKIQNIFTFDVCQF